MFDTFTKKCTWNYTAAYTILSAFQDFNLFLQVISMKCSKVNDHDSASTHYLLVLSADSFINSLDPDQA